MNGSDFIVFRQRGLPCWGALFTAFALLCSVTAGRMRAVRIFRARFLVILIYRISMYYLVKCFQGSAIPSRDIVL